MKEYLNQRGYREADVSFDVKIDNAEATVTYTADPKELLYIDEMITFSRDSGIQRILDETKGEAILKSGSPLDIRLHNQERARITKEIQNRGYAFFEPVYIVRRLRVDTTGGYVRAAMEILSPTDSTYHERYKIGTISVYPDFALEGDSITVDSVVNGIHFHPANLPMIVNPIRIQSNIYLKTGAYYNKDDIQLTKRQLGKLDAFKFISVKGTVDSLEANTLNYVITLTPNKKMSIGGDFELSYSSISASRRSLMGVFGNISYRNRNLLRGAEFFTTNLEGGVEFNLANRQGDSVSLPLVNSVNVNFSNNLAIPKFIDPFGIYNGLSSMKVGKKRMLGPNFNSWLQEETSTNISLSFNFLSLYNFYDYNSLNAAFGYNVQPESGKRIQINHIGLNYFNPVIKENFQLILDDNKFLEQSFGKQLFTGILFRDYNYSVAKAPNRSGFSWGIRHGFEVSGFEVYGANQLYNLFSKKNEVFQLRNRQDTVEFSQFMKFEVLYNARQELGPKSSIALKLHGGLAFPYGPFINQVPYVKQFFAGGALSNRAWIIRELGPGSHRELNLDPNNPYYQSGDILIDLSLEYRFNLFWIFNGALFVDAANVWTLKEDPDRPEANFTSNFIDQMAMGYGWGVRMDFSYFLLRLDFGYKLRSPFPLESGGHWYPDAFRKFPSGGNPNFAVNYPF